MLRVLRPVGSGAMEAEDGLILVLMHYWLQRSRLVHELTMTCLIFEELCCHAIQVFFPGGGAAAEGEGAASSWLWSHGN